MDVVFVHGIRGGPFASWRKGSSPTDNSLESSTLSHCWPNAWLSRDLPEARLLSLEYAAPASGWEVRCSIHSQHCKALLLGVPPLQMPAEVYSCNSGRSGHVSG